MFMVSHRSFLVPSRKEEHKVPQRIQSTKANRIKENKPFPVAKNQQQQKIPARFPIDSLPQADHTKNQSTTVNRQV